MRHCELFALRWDRINFCEKGIQCLINQSYNTQYKHIKETKTGKSRNIWLDERAREIIRTLRDFYQSKNRSVTGNSLVFQKSNGNRYDSTDLNRIWYGEHTEKRKKFMGVARLVAAQELPQYLDAYSTRRTFTSLQINAGHNPYTVADYIGDNIDTVIKHYYQGQRVDGAIPYLGFQA